MPATKYRSALLLLLVCLLTTTMSLSLRAQQQGLKATSGIRLLSVAVAPYGWPKIGRGLVLRASLESSLSEDVTITLVAALQERPSIEYAREVQLKANSVRAVDWEILLPADLGQLRNLDLICSVRQIVDGKEVMINNDGDPIEERLPIRLEDSRVVTATLLNPAPVLAFEWEWPKKDLNETYEWMVTTRITAGQRRQVLELENSFLPTQLSELDPIDNIVLAEPRPLEHLASLRSLRDWLMRGGRLWIMLDRVDAKLVQPLLQPGQSITSLGHTDVARLKVRSSMTFDPENQQAEVVLQDPVRLERIRQRGGEETHWINGEPAAVWMPVGYGEILFTTASPMAWIEPRPATTRSNSNSWSDESYMSAFQHRAWVGALADRFHVNRVETLPHDPLISYPTERIGFKVIQRGILFVILGAFCVALSAISIGLWWRSRAEHLLWLAPLFALVIGGGLAFVASRMRSEIPETYSRFELRDIHGNSGSSVVYEESSVYFPQPKAAVVTQLENSWLEPVPGEPDSRIFRWTKQEDNNNRLQSDSWPTGIWRASGTSGQYTEAQPIIAEFSNQGLALSPATVDGQPLEDCLLAQARSPRSTAIKGSEGRLQVVPQDSLPPNQWFRESLLNDEQRRRSAVWDAALKPLSTGPVPGRLSLLGWLPSTGSYPTLEPEVARTGASLVRLPVVLRSPSPNQPIVIPPVLIPAVSVTSAQGQVGAYQNSSGQWTGPFTSAITTLLRCSVPNEAMPFQCNKVDIEMRLRAPGREVSLRSPVGSTSVAIANWTSPQQVVNVTTSDEQLLKQIESGSFDLEVAVGGLPKSEGGSNSEQVSNWQIEYLWITLSGNGNVLKTDSSDSSGDGK